MMLDPNAAAAIHELREEIERLKARVTELEGHPAVSVPPLKVAYDPFRPSNTGDVK